MIAKTALILIDFINDIVSEQGKLSAKGYFAFMEKHHTQKNVIQLLEHARSQQWEIFHISIGFSDDYSDCPALSPMFSGAKKENALKLKSWGGDFADFIIPKENEIQLTKQRVSAFFNTELASLLEKFQIEHLVIAGCSTDLSVQSTVRDAHDRDFQVTVVIDACAAANDADHINSIPLFNKISHVVQVNELLSGKR